MLILRSFAVLSVALSLGACGAGGAPENRGGGMFMQEKAAPPGVAAANVPPQNPACPDAGLPHFIMPPRPPIPGTGRKPYRIMRYSAGDRINIKIIDGEDFSGDFAINADGLLHVPFARPVHAVGLTNDELAGRIRAQLLSAQLFQPETLKLSVRPVQYAPVQVTVSGAVFRPGRVLINQIKDADKQQAVLAKIGDSPTERFVAAALRSAGGVRPDADVSAVILARGKHRYRLDWRGAFTGIPVDDLPLIAGDHIDVLDTPCFQSGLMRPSQITPDGIRVFVSNLTVPATANAAAAVSQFAQSLPYGTRFLQGIVSGNCVGGALATNGHRSAVLISTNPKTGRTEVIERSIEELVRSADRDTINPYLMPDDAIACYDSAVTNARDAAAALSVGLGAVIQGKALVK